MAVKMTHNLLFSVRLIAALISLIACGALVILAGENSEPPNNQRKITNLPQQADQNSSWLRVLGTDGKPGVKIDVQVKRLVGSPAWSPNGKQIAFDALSGSQTNYTSAHLFVCDANGSHQNDLGTGAMPDWSPDGKQLTFHDYSDRAGIWIMNADGSDRKQIHTIGSSPSWSPKGRYIAFQSGELYLYDIKTEKLSRHENPEAKGISLGVTWSPDGKKICFAKRSQGAPEMMTVDAHDSSIKAELVYKGWFGPIRSWSSDGKTISVDMKEPGKSTRLIHAVDVKFETAPRIFSGQETDRYNSSADFSPDGKRLVYVSRPIP